MAPCVVCGKMLKGGVGIFCGNFCRGRGGFPPCANAWCGSCYTESPNDPFPQQQKVEEDAESEILLDEEDERRHRSGRNSDHLRRVPFECDLFHYRSTNNREPVWSSPKAMATLEAIMQVNLDVFWAREPATLRGNLNRI